MAEYRLRELTVRTTPNGEIEITQDHLEDVHSDGVLIRPEQVDMLIQYLGWAVRDLNDELDAKSG